MHRRTTDIGAKRTLPTRRSSGGFGPISFCCARNGTGAPHHRSTAAQGPSQREGLERGRIADVSTSKVGATHCCDLTFCPYSKLDDRLWFQILSERGRYQFTHSERNSLRTHNPRPKQTNGPLGSPELLLQGVKCDTKAGPQRDGTLDSFVF